MLISVFTVINLNHCTIYGQEFVTITSFEKIVLINQNPKWMTLLKGLIT